jgi:glycine/D-amino acid oxidase-like deaminating enzyme
MHARSGENISAWLATADWLDPEPLLEQDDADICVIGAGIAGMTTAYMLALEGRSVMVLLAREQDRNRRFGPWDDARDHRRHPHHGSHQRTLSARSKEALK